MSLRMLKDLDLEFDAPLSLLPIFEMEGDLYQGAHTGAYAEGLFVAHPEQDIFVWHNDVKSMYPSIQRLCNFSPESMSLVRLKPYTGQIFLSPERVEVPDKNINKQLIIDVDTEDSVARKELTTLMDLRAKYRAERSDSAEKGMKLAANASYGYNGMKFAKYGSFLVAIGTCAVGRHIMEGVVDIVEENPQTVPLENDTDGVYHYGPTILPDIQALIRNIFKDYPEKYAIRVDTTKYFGMLCTGKKKNYVLRKEYKNIVKGNSLKGRSMPPIVKETLEEVASCLFEGKDINETWVEMNSRLNTALLADFEMSCEVGKDEYEPHTMYAKILKQAPWMTFGEELRYVKVKKCDKFDYLYVPLGAHPDQELWLAIERSYYLKRMKDVAARLLEPCRKNDPTIDQFMKEHIDKKKKKRKKKA